MDKEYQKLLDSFASIDKKLKEIDAKKVTKTTTVDDEKPGAPENEPDSDDMMNKMRGIAEDLYASLRHTADYLHNRINQTHDRISDHGKALNDHANPPNATHPLPLKTPTQIKAYLKSCAMSDEVDVVKPRVWANASRKNEIEVDLSADFKKK